MNFGEAIKFGFSNYANFQGRSRRSGYWYWALFNALVTFMFNVLAGGKQTTSLESSEPSQASLC